jgi:hypothetical protein
VEKKKSNVVWTVTFDPKTRLPVEIEEAVISIAKADAATGAPEQYYIFTTRLTLDRFGDVERIDVPREALPVMK